MATVKNPIIEALAGLPLSAYDGWRQVADARHYIEQKERAWRDSPEYIEKSRKDEQLRQGEIALREARERVRVHKVKAWAKVNLKPGIRIKVKGARDGNGDREVISVTDNRVQCWQLWGGKRRNQVTDHGIEKITHYWQDFARIGQDRGWVKIGV
jgi:hypothetical protein